VWSSAVGAQREGGPLLTPLTPLSLGEESSFIPQKMATPYELKARADAMYAKYEKYVVKRAGGGEDEDGRRADGAYGSAYAALLDRVNVLMQVRRGGKEKRGGRRRGCVASISLSIPLTPTHTSRKQTKCDPRRTGRPRRP